MEGLLASFVRRCANLQRSCCSISWCRVAFTAMGCSCVTSVDCTCLHARHDAHSALCAQRNHLAMCNPATQAHLLRGLLHVGCCLCVLRFAPFKSGTLVRFVRRWCRTPMVRQFYSCALEPWVKAQLNMLCSHDFWANPKRLHAEWRNIAICTFK